MTLRSMASVFLTLLCASSTMGQETGRGRASIDAKGDIWVGQKVTVVIELLAPGTFASAPAFDLPQVPGVILIPPEGRPLLGTETIDGTTFTSQRHELTAYSQRAGSVEIPEFAVRFESSTAFGKPSVQQRVTIPALEFVAKLPPGAKGLSTVITTRELKITETWDPPELDKKFKPGDAITRTIKVVASDTPAMVIPAFHFEVPEGLAVYPKSPVLGDTSERGETKGTRTESMTIVCKNAGRFSLPALVLAWWDPDKKELQRVELPAQTIEVVSPPTTDLAPAPPPHRRSWEPAALILAALLTAGVLVIRLGSPTRDWFARRQASPAESEPTCFHKFELACKSGDPHAIYLALLAWLSKCSPEGSPVSIESFAAHQNDPQLTAALTSLGACIYGDHGNNDAGWSSQVLLDRVRTARADFRKPSKSKHSSLPPLNPTF